MANAECSHIESEVLHLAEISFLLSCDNWFHKAGMLKRNHKLPLNSAIKKTRSAFLCQSQATIREGTRNIKRHSFWARTVGFSEAGVQCAIGDTQSNWKVCYKMSLCFVICKALSTVRSSWALRMPSRNKVKCHGIVTYMQETERAKYTLQVSASSLACPRLVGSSGSPC